MVAFAPFSIELLFLYLLICEKKTNIREISPLTKRIANIFPTLLFDFAYYGFGHA